MGLGRDVKKEMIKGHLVRNTTGGTLEDFAQAFPDLKRKDISNLLQELKREGVIYSEGRGSRAIWKVRLV